VIRLSWQEIGAGLIGRAATLVPATPPTGISTDSRSIGPGELFIALRGENFDGHQFVAAARQRGAVGAVIATERLADVNAALGSDGPPCVLLTVDEPLTALGRLGRYHRQRLRAPVIAVVGSNGKTTTKMMIHHVLSGTRRGRCSPKSFNNNIGVPLTLLAADADDEYLIVEIGTNAPGEVADLAALAQPTLAIITSLGEEHLEGLGDLTGVAREETSVLGALTSRFAVVNVDQPLIRDFLVNYEVNYTTYGMVEDADLRLTSLNYEAPWLHFEVNGRFRFRLPVPGAHNATNAVGALAVARRLGLDHAAIAARLETFSPPPMRCEVAELGGVTVLNDAYNANPQSALAAVAMLEAQPCRGRRIVVFGEMRELGKHAPAQHARVAERLRSAAVDRVILVGAAGGLMGPTLGAAAECWDTVEVAAARLPDEVRPGDVVLLKASRAVGLERLMPALRARLSVAAG
jgi:UDP-N-acetylmuramoyl-tripeptide--D-alanyl-D-alanine ligase